MSGSRWAEKLKQFNEAHSSKSGESQQGDEELLEKYYTQFKGSKDEDKKYSLIPKFYSKPPTDEQVLQQKLREEARATFLQRRSSELMDNEELQKLWSILEEKHTPPDVGEEQVFNRARPSLILQKSEEERFKWSYYCSESPPYTARVAASTPHSTVYTCNMIGFADFMKIQDQVSEKCHCFFTAKVFAKLLRDDPYGRVSITQLFSYIMRKVWLQQTRIGLSLFDIQGLGYLKESDLENYILELIPTLPQLNCLEESFYSFYVCTAVRKFFFFLDPMRTGKIKIQDILACGFLDDLLELRDEELSKETQETNWFSAPSALRVYGQYLSLDTDHNGMLNKEELLRYGTGTLTKVFVDRVFQECLTYDGEVDYKTYLDFVLAMENRKEPQALQYLLRLVDIRGQGYLDAFTLNYFFRAIQEQMKVHGHEPVKFEDIKDEIFDMVKPADPLRITLQDLIKSGQGDTVIGILTDLNGFWTYENREVLLAESQEIGTG